MSELKDRLAVSVQHLLPKRALTELMGALARSHGGAMTTAAIRWFIRRYGVQMAEAAEPDPAAYASFNDFFTRELAAGARPLAPADWLCPVDGAISQFGRIEGDRLLQAKGHTYTVRALLGGNETLAAAFADGHFATLYLSPRDYHRIHMPCAARLRRMIHVPGALYSVNPVTARGVPGLFARNERVVCLFDAQGDAGRPAEQGAGHGAGGTTAGDGGGDGAGDRHGGLSRAPFAMVLVGATIVGSMATSWHGVVNPPRPARAREWGYDGEPVRLQRGQEMGRFLLGSTVVMLWPRGSLVFNPGWAPGRPIRMGEPMASNG